MTTFSIIQKSQLEGAMRLDAEYYHPEKLKALKILKKYAGKNISNYFFSSKKIFNPANQKLDESAVVYDLTDALGLFLSDGLKVKSEKEIGSAKRILEKNDVIISRLRSYLKEISFVFDNENLKLASAEFFAFRKKKNINISPELLFSFLQTGIVQKILEWSQEGVNHPRFSDDAILNLKLPDILLKSQDEIKDSVRSGYDSYLNSKSLYQQAEKLLLKELDLEDFNLEENLSTIVNFSDIFEARRMDAEYFQGKYEKILKTVSSKFKMKNLEEIFNFKRGIFISTDYYTDKKTNTSYIRIKELAEKGGINKSEIMYINKKYSGNEKDKIKKDDLVIAIIGDTIGKTNKIDQELDGGYCSNNTGRLRLKKDFTERMIPECNEILFQSIFVQSQIERKKAQTGQPKISDAEIKSIKIPILPKETQQKIADLVRQSNEARKKAKFLLEKAKQEVENLIESN